MKKQTTLTFIKPDSVKKKHIGEIISRYERSGLSIVGIKMVEVSTKKAEEFYCEHKEKPFFGELVSFITSGAVVAIALKGEDAVAKNRKIIGATNPANAEIGTIRASFAETIDSNAIHGSDSEESASRELAFFFDDDEILESI